MSLNHTELATHVSRSMAQALGQLMAQKRIEEVTVSLVMTVARNHFWLKRTAEDVAEVWEKLRSEDATFNTLIRAYNIFRFSYELDSGTKYSELMEHVIRLQTDLVFRDDQDRSLVDDQYLQRVDPSEVDYPALMRTNGWFVFLLILEMTGWGLKIGPVVSPPDSNEE